MPEHQSYLDTTIALVGQFSSHGGGVDHNIVQFVLAGSAWGLLLWFALYRRNKKHIMPHEDLLAWGFAFGLAREIFMLSLTLLQTYGIISNDILHVFFPPLEHALLDFAMVIICGAFIRYLLPEKRPTLSYGYLRIGIATVSACYLVSFWWWGKYIMAHPASKFGQTWCEWIFRTNSSILIAIALAVILVHTRGWVRNTVCLALSLFFMHEFLKIVDIALNETYEAQITPFRHGAYILGIPILGFVYLREQEEMEEQVENALQRSEMLYRTLVENVNLGITLIDCNHTILMANRAQHEIFNKPSGYFKGRKCFQEFERRTTICSHCPGVKAMATGLPHETDVDNTREDGSRFTVRIKAFPVLDSRGRAESFIEVVEDITLRQKIEEELQQARNIESIGVLAGGIAHDFNNILATIFGYTDLATLKQEKRQGVARELEQIRKASIRARDLVRQILTLSRKQEQEKKPLQLSLIVKEALKLLRSSIPSTIDIRQNINSEARALADATQVHQLIMNLCTNAYQAMEETGGTLDVSMDEMSIGSEESLFGKHVLAPGRYIRLTVTDNGPGIPQSIRDRIFEPYFTTKEVGKGTGLGLSVVMGIIKNHDGRINVYSEPGTGTTMSVYLPVCETEADADEPETGKEDRFQARGDERIMIVDDERGIRDMLVSYLINFGYSVDVYENGQDAWNAYKQNPHHWDMLITDQTMPGLTGTDLIPRVRLKRPDFPVILCSGYSKNINEKTIRELRVDQFFNKPATMNELLEGIRATLDSRRRLAN